MICHYGVKTAVKVFEPFSDPVEFDLTATFRVFTSGFEICSYEITAPDSSDIEFRSRGCKQYAMTLPEIVGYECGDRRIDLL